MASAAALAVVLALHGAALPGCTARDLHAVSAELQGATGSMLGGIRFRNVSRSRCAVGGRPHVALMTTAHKVFATRRGAFSSGRAVTSVAAGKTVELRLDWSNWCGPWTGSPGAFRTVVARIRLTSGATLWVRVKTGRPRCDQPSAPSTLSLSRFVAA